VGARTQEAQGEAEWEVEQKMHEECKKQEHEERVKWDMQRKCKEEEAAKAKKRQEEEETSVTRWLLQCMSPNTRQRQR